LLAAVVLVAGICGGAGWLLGARDRGGPTTTLPSAVPVSAADPAIPGGALPPPAPDIAYPALQPHLTYHRVSQGPPRDRWSFSVPVGWPRVQENSGQCYWRPEGEPTEGGFFLRTKLETSFRTPEQLVAFKEGQMLDPANGYEDVRIFMKNSNTLGFTYRTSSNHLRWNIWRWITPPGDELAGFEMSVGGRKIDQHGLDDLLTEVSASARKVPD